MSDDLVARLRGGCVLLPKRWSGDTGSDRPYGLLIVDVKETDGLMRAAADRIEALAAERDTLAEMVRAARIKVRPTASGPWLNCESPDITPDQAERFQQVLDRITKEGSDDE